MNKEKIFELMQATENDVAFAKELSDKIVQEKTIELDELMRAIQNDVVNKDCHDLFTLEHYLLVLTNARYFINTRIENFGFYEDITKANARVRYNEAYSENQLQAASDGRKTTQSDNQLYAETNSLNETMLNLIYVRSSKIIKGKIESADEMIRTLSKLISVQMNENSIARMADKIN